jgi:hypothetical protein
MSQLLVLPLEVVPPIVIVESLARSLPVDSEVDQLACDLEIRIGDALGVSLSKVHTRYFWDSDEGKIGI